MATDLQRGFAGGTWWADLAEIRDTALVTTAVVAALDLRGQAGQDPLQVLLSSLRDRELLLVLDNCEHLLDVSARLVSDILLDCAECAGAGYDPGGSPSPPTTTAVITSRAFDTPRLKPGRVTYVLRHVLPMS